MICKNVGGPTFNLKKVLSAQKKYNTELRHNIQWGLTKPLRSLN